LDVNREQVIRDRPLRHVPDSGRQEARHFAGVRLPPHEGR
jgi:hypothetical protein